MGASIRIKALRPEFRRAGRLFTMAEWTEIDGVALRPAETAALMVERLLRIEIRDGDGWRTLQPKEREDIAAYAGMVAVARGDGPELEAVLAEPPAADTQYQAPAAAPAAGCETPSLGAAEGEDRESAPPSDDAGAGEPPASDASPPPSESGGGDAGGEGAPPVAPPPPADSPPADPPPPPPPAAETGKGKPARAKPH